MECPVCLDTIIKPYYLKNCSHVICFKCHREIKKTSEKFPLPTVKEIPIKCPLCRKREKVCLNEIENIQWLEIQLTEDEDGVSYYHTMKKNLHSDGGHNNKNIQKPYKLKKIDSYKLRRYK
jgi:hypothetical protein